MQRLSLHSADPRRVLAVCATDQSLWEPWVQKRQTWRPTRISTLPFIPHGRQFLREAETCVIPGVKFLLKTGLQLWSSQPVRFLQTRVWLTVFTWIHSRVGVGQWGAALRILNVWTRCLRRVVSHQRENSIRVDSVTYLDERSGVMQKTGIYAFNFSPRSLLLLLCLSWLWNANSNLRFAKEAIETFRIKLVDRSFHFVWRTNKTATFLQTCRDGGFCTRHVRCAAGSEGGKEKFLNFRILCNVGHCWRLPVRWAYCRRSSV